MNPLLSLRMRSHERQRASASGYYDPKGCGSLNDDYLALSPKQPAARSASATADFIGLVSPRFNNDLSLPSRFPQFRAEKFYASEKGEGTIPLSVSSATSLVVVPKGQIAAASQSSYLSCMQSSRIKHWTHKLGTGYNPFELPTEPVCLFVCTMLQPACLAWLCLAEA